MEPATQKNIDLILEGTGIHINGDNPWDIIVHNKNFYNRVLAEGSLGFGESYMDGWWDCDQLDELIHRLMKSNATSKLKPSLSLILEYIKASLFNLQNKNRAFKIGEAHYDVGNDLYQQMLDKRLTYTCGYWKNAGSLNEAQENKLDLVCKKINLQPGQRVLDIGCGWGSFAKFAAEKYQAKVVGVTVSKEQISLGQKLCQNLPVELRYQDYRDVDEKFDHIVSLGMLEHVGYKNFDSYFQVVKRCLKDNGLFLLHTIGCNKTTKMTDPWITKYIFPNSMLPSAVQLAKASEKLFVTEDWHNFSADYDKTLMSWYQNFATAWPQLKENYDKRFYRMWRFYLLSCAGVFRARKNQLWQIVYSNSGVPGGYHSIR